MTTIENPGKGSQGRNRPLGVSAFTLVELLVTIAIIAVLAGLVLPLAGIATTKMRIARVKTELNRYMNAIESYKLETGEYPPDHGLLEDMSTNDWKLYRERAALNPLYYELTGAVFTNREYVTVAGNERVDPSVFEKVFKRRGIRNSARLRSEIDYKGFTAKSAQFAELELPPAQYSIPAEADVEVLKVPVPGPFTLPGRKGQKIFPWFYDASSTNRHNLKSYDLWAEILVQGKTNIVGNWK